MESLAFWILRVRAMALSSFGCFHSHSSTEQAILALVARHLWIPWSVKVGDLMNSPQHLSFLPLVWNLGKP